MDVHEELLAHIASMPVAVNIQCHSARHRRWCSDGSSCHHAAHRRGRACARVTACSHGVIYTGGTRRTSVWWSSSTRARLCHRPQRPGHLLRGAPPPKPVRSSVGRSNHLGPHGRIFAQAHRPGTQGMIGRALQRGGQEALKRDKAAYLAATGGAGAPFQENHLGQSGGMKTSAPKPSGARGQGIPGGSHQRHVRRRPVRKGARSTKEGFLAQNRETANVGPGLKATGMWAWLLFRISGSPRLHLGAHIIIIPPGSSCRRRDLQR
jgi:hypothetical protein